MTDIVALDSAAAPCGPPHVPYTLSAAFWRHLEALDPKCARLLRADGVAAGHLVVLPGPRYVVIVRPLHGPVAPVFPGLGGDETPDPAPPMYIVFRHHPDADAPAVERVPSRAYFMHDMVRVPYPFGRRFLEYVRRDHPATAAFIAARGWTTGWLVYAPDAPDARFDRQIYVEMPCRVAPDDPGHALQPDQVRRAELAGLRFATPTAWTNRPVLVMSAHPDVQGASWVSGPQDEAAPRERPAGWPVDPAAVAAVEAPAWFVARAFPDVPVRFAVRPGAAPGTSVLTGPGGVEWTLPNYELRTIYFRAAPKE